MEKSENFLKRIIDNLQFECCVIKDGDFLSANEPFEQMIRPDEVPTLLTSCRNEESGSLYRTNGFLYSVKEVELDSTYSMIFLKKTADSSALFDSLTGALQRECFNNITDRLLQEAKLLNKILVFLYLDLDGFKLINDTWGHESGDVVLKTTVERITNTIRPGDFCFRMGGDEFLIVLAGIRDRIHSCLVARRLISAISEPIPLTGPNKVRIGASIGIAGFPADGSNLEDLVNKADEAMYRAKKLGKNNYQLYE